jgi:hypothetical protein
MVVRNSTFAAEIDASQPISQVRATARNRSEGVSGQASSPLSDFSVAMMASKVRDCLSNCEQPAPPRTAKVVEIQVSPEDEWRQAVQESMSRHPSGANLRKTQQQEANSLASFVVAGS